MAVLFPEPESPVIMSMVMFFTLDLNYIGFQIKVLARIEGAPSE
jgi:hypothetical protein